MGKHVRIENVRISYPHLYQPRTSPNFPTAAAKYSADFLVDAKSDVNIVPMVTAAVQEIVAAANFNGAYREPPWENDGGILRIKCKSSTKPHVIDEYGNALNEMNDKIYSGCRVHAYISVFSYTNNGNGISFGLEGVMFAGDDERLDAKPDPGKMFEGLTAGNVNHVASTPQGFPAQVTMPQIPPAAAPAPAPAPIPAAPAPAPAPVPVPAAAPQAPQPPAGMLLQ